MNRLILTEGDLQTIENALRNTANQCRQDAEAYPAFAPGAAESADQYEALAEKICEADQIVVERIP